MFKKSIFSQYKALHFGYKMNIKKKFSIKTKYFEFKLKTGRLTHSLYKRTVTEYFYSYGF